MKGIKLYIPTTKSDLLKRSAVRIGFCAAPYYLLTWLWSIYRDDQFFDGWWFFWCVVVIPGGGFALDVWRLMKTQDGGTKSVEPASGANAPPAEQRR